MELKFSHARCLAISQRARLHWPARPRVLARLIWGSGPLQVLRKRLNVLFRRILIDLTLVSIVYHTDDGPMVAEQFGRLGECSECSQRETGSEGNLETKRASDASPNTLWLWVGRARGDQQKATADCTARAPAVLFRSARLPSAFAQGLG